MSAADTYDVIIEAIEVFINHVLYIREVYPQCIFKKRRVYNTPIYVSIYPPLNSYILNVLNSARELLRNKDLKCVELLLYLNENEVKERYKFCLEDMASKPEVNESEDEYLLEFEESLRYSIYKMAELLNVTKKLENEVKCKILLHTTQNAFVKLTQNSEYQEFPWIRFPQYESVAKKLSLLPLTEIEEIGLHMYVEI